MQIDRIMIATFRFSFSLISLGASFHAMKNRRAAAASLMAEVGPKPKLLFSDLVTGKRPLNKNNATAKPEIIYTFLKDKGNLKMVSSIIGPMRQMYMMAGTKPIFFMNLSMSVWYC